MSRNEKSHRVTSEIQTAQTHDVAVTRSRTILFVFVFRTFTAAADFTFKPKYKKRNSSYTNSLAEQ